MDDCDWLLSVEKACDWLRIESGVTRKFFLGHLVECCVFLVSCLIGSVQERESEREAMAVWAVVVVRWRLLSELQQVVDREERREDGTATLPLLLVSQSVSSTRLPREPSLSTGEKDEWMDRRESSIHVFLKFYMV